MTSRLSLLLVVCLAIAGCGGKKDEPKPKPGSDSAGTASAEPVQRIRLSQEPLPAMPALDLPPDAKRTEKVKLGNALFFDKRLSGSNDRACYSCHKNADGNGGKDPLAIGSGDKTLTRHSPTLWNVGYFKGAFYWDGRAKTLEANAKGAWGGPNMAAGDKDPKKNDEILDKRAADLAALPEYKALFEAAFPNTKPIKAEHVQSALAEYMRSMVCNNTAYDRWANKDKTALDDKQQRGLDLFLSKGACNKCHVPPYFSSAMNVDNGAYFNVGIGTQGVAEDKVDIGRKVVTKDDNDWASFKPPSLRNVSKTAPYFHDGSVDTLEKAVRLMAAGGYPNKNKSPLANPTNLTPAEIEDIIAFLKALDCNTKLTLPDGSEPDDATFDGAAAGGSGAGSGSAGSAAGSGSTAPASGSGSGSAAKAGSGSGSAKK